MKKINYFSLILIIVSKILCSNFLYAVSATKVLHELGFKTLNQKAIDFALKNISGSEFKLSEFKGKWIWLVFWAPWCLPCQEELPRLEDLYQTFKKDNFIIISVTTSGLQEVKDFLSTKTISFPVLLDSSHVSRLYSATSIPIIYAISPEFNIVGVLRGESIFEKQKVKELLTSKTDLSEAEEKDLVEMPQSIAPPQIELLFDKTTTFYGDKITGKIKITWKGSSQKYLIKIPLIKVPEELIISDFKPISEAATDTASLIYLFEVKAKKVGIFSIGPVELEYSNREGGGKEYVRVDETSLEWQKKSYKIHIVVITLILLVGMAVSIMMILNKKKKVVEKKSEWPEKINALYQQKVHLSKDEYAARLIGLLLEVDPDNKDILSMLNRIKYGALSLSEEELRHYEKMLDKFIKEGELS